jgi:hypothetical protein
MTAPTGWPDASKPGVPLNPERAGWHWLANINGAPSEMFCLHWTDDRLDAGDFRWDQGEADVYEEDAALFWRYLGPCLTPQDVAARVEAAAVAMREACEAFAAGYDIDDGSWSWRNGQEHAADKIARRIRNTPTPTDALAAALAQARRDALEEALTIAREAQSFVVYERIQAAIRAKAQEAGDE